MLMGGEENSDALDLGEKHRNRLGVQRGNGKQGLTWGDVYCKTWRGDFREFFCPRYSEVVKKDGPTDSVE
jgi:hypothetical protein